MTLHAARIFPSHGTSRTAFLPESACGALGSPLHLQIWQAGLSLCVLQVLVIFLRWARESRCISRWAWGTVAALSTLAQKTDPGRSDVDTRVRDLAHTRGPAREQIPSARPGQELIACTIFWMARPWEQTKRPRPVNWALGRSSISSTPSAAHSNSRDGI